MYRQRCSVVTRMGAVLILVGLMVACATPQRSAPAASPGQVQAGAPSALDEAAPAPAALESITVVGSSPTEISSLVWSLAINLGYFRDVGLEPQFVSLPSAQMLAAVLTGDAQYAMDMTGHVSGLLEAHGTLPVRLLAVLAARPQHAVLAQPQYPSIAALKGRTLAVKAAGDTGHRAAKLLWQANGLDPVADMHVLPIGTEQARLTAMQAGSVEAAVFTPPAIAMAQTLGYRMLGRASDVSNVPQSGVWTLGTRVEERPTEVVAVLRTLLRALQFMHNPTNREVVLATINQALDVKDDAVAAGLYQGALDGLSTDGTVPASGIQELIELQNAQRDTPVPLDPASFTDWGPLHTAQRDLAAAVRGR